MSACRNCGRRVRAANRKRVYSGTRHRPRKFWVHRICPLDDLVAAVGRAVKSHFEDRLRALEEKYG
jgi:hypothetical protein